MEVGRQKEHLRGRALLNDKRLVSLNHGSSKPQWSDAFSKRTREDNKLRQVMNRTDWPSTGQRGCGESALFTVESPKQSSNRAKFPNGHTESKLGKDGSHLPLEDRDTRALSNITKKVCCSTPENPGPSTTTWEPDMPWYEDSGWQAEMFQPLPEARMEMPVGDISLLSHSPTPPSPQRYMKYHRPQVQRNTVMPHITSEDYNILNHLSGVCRALNRSSPSPGRGHVLEDQHHGHPGQDQEEEEHTHGEHQGHVLWRPRPLHQRLQ